MSDTPEVECPSCHSLDRTERKMLPDMWWCADCGHTFTGPPTSQTRSEWSENPDDFSICNNCGCPRDTHDGADRCPA